jgi:hypothetical protein
VDSSERITRFAIPAFTGKKCHSGKEHKNNKKSLIPLPLQAIKTNYVPTFPMFHVTNFPWFMQNF